MPPPLVIGHRGAPGYRPEHTRSSYGIALSSGVDAVEPDVVPTRDGVLVVRHESEIGATTDVADRPSFAARRTTKTVDGTTVTGWFTEDFTWDELSTLRARERLPRLRTASAACDGREPILRLRDVLDLVAASPGRSQPPGLVLEVKHAAHFAALGFDIARMVADELDTAGWTPSGRAADRPLWIESFEPTVLSQLQALGVAARYVFLFEAEGAPADLIARDGASARPYAAWAEAAGLDDLVGAVDGVSVDKRMILEAVRAPRARHDEHRDAGTGTGTGEGVVARARARGLSVFTWTCRPENAFLVRRFRTGGGKAAFGDYRGEWGLLAASGVDGVFVDHPDLGVDFFAPQPQAPPTTQTPSTRTTPPQTPPAEAS